MDEAENRKVINHFAKLLTSSNPLVLFLSDKTQLENY